MILHGNPIIPGEARGLVLATREPLSFWGGYDYHTGEIIDHRHPLCGQIASRRILALPFSRGSSTTTAVLLEAIKAGTAPVAILTSEIDTFFALASIVADVMYAARVPLVALTLDDFSLLQSGMEIEIELDGKIRYPPIHP